MELDAISQPELERLEQIGDVDLVVGILDFDHQQEGGTALALTRAALGELSRPLRAVVVCNNGTHSPDPADGIETPPREESLALFPCRLPGPGPAETLQQTISTAYRNVFTVGTRLGVRACGVIASHPQDSARQWIYRLLQPVMDLGFDLVAPCYTRQKMEGLLNRSILSPLHRALYGEQLQNPLGPDFGISAKLMRQVLGQESVRRREPERSTLITIAAAAADGNFQVCESHLGLLTQRLTDWENLSSLLASVLGPTFLEMEGRAASWQSIRGSKTLPRFGVPEILPPEDAPADAGSMIESFRLGAQNLQDVWGLILPPTSLLELRRLARLPAEQFQLPDYLWVRIVYDFALAHRLRTISRDHLLRSMTPLYLGWIASYALEMQHAGMAEVDARLEQLAKTYEDNKSYLVSRWRWPDRFNP